MKHFIFLFLSATSLSAQHLDGEAFQAQTEGQTIYFYDLEMGVVAEQYLPNRQVLWSVGPGMCLEGSWYDDGQNICFEYVGRPDPICWTTSLDQGRILVELVGGDSSDNQFEVYRTDEPLDCPQILLGV